MAKKNGNVCLAFGVFCDMLQVEESAAFAEEFYEAI